MTPKVILSESTLLAKDIRFRLWGNKTVPNAIGVDMIANNEFIETLVDTVSTADVNADITKPLPFAREY